MLPTEIRNLILDYHASIEEYPRRLELHRELHMLFRFKIHQRLNEEFSFIFYPGFYQDLEITDYHGNIHVIHVTHVM